MNVQLRKANLHGKVSLYAALCMLSLPSVQAGFQVYTDKHTNNKGVKAPINMCMQYAERVGEALEPTGKWRLAREGQTQYLRAKEA